MAPSISMDARIASFLAGAPHAVARGLVGRYWHDLDAHVRLGYDVPTAIDREQGLACELRDGHGRRVAPSGFFTQHGGRR
jgi:hypothetical protein